MAIVINYNGASLRKAGAYSKLKVADSGAADAQLGVLALIGEANEGAAFADESLGLDAVSFGPDQYSDIVAKFGSGPLVDAAKLALSPSADQQIVGGAQKLILLKTNASVKASKALASSYGTVYAKKAGEPGNSVAITIANSSGKRVITISDALTGESEVSSPLGGRQALTIQVPGATTATLTISATSFVTTVVGGPSSLNIPLAQFNTIADLVEYLQLQSGYTVALGSNTELKNQPLTVLDRVTGLDIKTSVQSLDTDAFDIRQFFAESAIIDFTPTAYSGLPAVASKAFLSGGAKGITTNLSIQECFDGLLKSQDCNFIAPLFSRDASADITDGLTDSLSTYTIASIHAAARSHAASTATIKGRKERQVFVGFKGTLADTKDAQAQASHARLQLCFQDIDVTDSFNNVFQAQPHMLAVISAGMKAAAAVGLPNTFKAVNILGFHHPEFDPATQYDEGIDANLTFVEKAPGGGFRFVVDNSTYAPVKDAWIWARPSVIYAADVASKTIRLNMETFVGQRNSDVSAETIKNKMITVLDSLRTSGIIVPDAISGGKGWKDLTVKIDGSVVKISVSLILVEGIEFVLADLTVQRASF